LGAAATDAGWDRELERGRQLAARGQYEEARRTFESARDRAERFGPQDPRLAIAWNNLGAVYLRLNSIGDAERCYRRSAAIWEGRGDAVNALAPLTNVAEVYLARRQWSAADKLLYHALDLSTQRLGSEHPQTAAIVAYLSDSAFQQGDYEGAAGLSARALAALRKIHASPHPDLAVALDNLGTMYRVLGRREDAARLFTEAVQVLEKTGQPDHPAWIRALDDLSTVYADQAHYNEAEVLLKRSLELGEKTLGPRHPRLARVLTHYAALLRKTNHKSRAKEMEKRARVILAESERDNSLGHTVDVRSLSSFR
jgi:tetratricopeptide (TPR) repeat protein